MFRLLRLFSGLDFDSGFCVSCYVAWFLCLWFSALCFVYLWISGFCFWNDQVLICCVGNVGFLRL